MTQAEAEWLLAECRRKIDAIDVQLRDLLNQRAGIVGDVVRAKEALSMPVYEPKREEDVLGKATSGNPGPLSDEAFRQIFGAIMREMRQIQQVYLDRQQGKDQPGNAKQRGTPEW
jgi:chorismate mutase